VTAPAILVTNDDGIHSEGLRALAEALAHVGEVTVVAPDRERSAAGHALTLHRPLRASEVAPGWHRVDGTPTDCVTLAVMGMLKRRPHLVVAGINLGANLGDDVTYSGTVSAAMEGILLGIPAFAISQGGGAPFEFTVAADFARRLAGLLVLTVGVDVHAVCEPPAEALAPGCQLRAGVAFAAQADVGEVSGEHVGRRFFFSFG